MNAEATGRQSPTRKGRLALLVGTLGAPATWAFHLFMSYGYAPATCADSPMWGLHLITVVSLIGIAVAATVAFLMWRGRLPIQGGHVQGVAYLGLLGLLLCGLFGALILLEAWPTWVADPCQGLGAPVGPA